MHAVQSEGNRVNPAHSWRLGLVSGEIVTDSLKSLIRSFRFFALARKWFIKTRVPPTSELEFLNSLCFLQFACVPARERIILPHGNNMHDLIHLLRWWFC